MNVYKTNDKRADISVSNGCVVGISLNEVLTESLTICIKKNYNGEKIEKIGDGSRGLLSARCQDNLDKQNAQEITIIIDDNISDFGELAFCQSCIAEIYIPLSCRILPARCFENSFIKHITGMENVEEIQQRCFFGTQKLSFINIPAKCRNIGYAAFSCSNIEKIMGGESVETLGTSVFQGSNLKQIKWFPKAEIIPLGTFLNCLSLESIAGIENVKEIKSAAFQGCGIRVIRWPDGCDTVPGYCFYHCEKFEKFISGEILRIIESNAFEGCITLSQFQFHSNFQTIGYQSFIYTKLKRVDLSETMVDTIGERAFAHTEVEEFIPSLFCSAVNEIFTDTPYGKKLV